MIIQCYFVVKSAIKQGVASSNKAATCFEEFRYISILAVRDRCCLSITSCAVCAAANSSYVWTKETRELRFCLLYATWTTS
jgi:hypothetical protein